MKIVINSHIRYKKSLSVLLQSILDSDVGVEPIWDHACNGLCFAWEVVVSIAGCEDDILPCREVISSVADVVLPPGWSAGALYFFINVYKSMVISCIFLSFRATNIILSFYNHYII